MATTIEDIEKRIDEIRTMEQLKAELKLLWRFVPLLPK